MNLGRSYWLNIILFLYQLFVTSWRLHERIPLFRGWDKITSAMKLKLLLLDLLSYKKELPWIEYLLVSYELEVNRNNFLQEIFLSDNENG